MGIRPGTRLRSAGQRQRRRGRRTGPRPPAFCEVEGCEKESRALGLCWMHYKRVQRHGDVEGR
jgi:hypothetical protein